jgi:uncharacterized protein
MSTGASVLRADIDLYRPYGSSHVTEPVRSSMLERDGYIPGVPCWVDTRQPDPEAAVAFYSGLFGWDHEDMMAPGSPGHYYVARLRRGDVAAIGSMPEGGPQSVAWNTYMWVQSADETASRVLAAGGRVLAGPFDVMVAGRMAVCADPEGATFSIWEAKEHKGAQIVNEPGSVNFNTLNTRDPEGAKSFYRALFGWDTLALPGGAAQMWRLPGYGDFLEQRDPGLRQRMAETAAAPDGFEDVVATLAPIAGDQPDVRAHWSVTFATEDADASAEKATALGGTVDVPPFDAPWVRMTVITDPQGATFTASKFVPETEPGNLAREPEFRPAAA